MSDLKGFLIESLVLGFVIWVMLVIINAVVAALGVPITTFIDVQSLTLSFGGVITAIIGFTTIGIGAALVSKIWSD